MIVAMIVERKTQALVSFAEGKTESEAKANAILQAPKEFDNLQCSELEWELTETAD